MSRRRPFRRDLALLDGSTRSMQPGPPTRRPARLVILIQGFRDMGCIVADAEITKINGPIGFMRRDLQAWLQAGIVPPHKP